MSSISPEFKQIENVEWAEFFIGGEYGLFEVESTSSGIDKNKLNTDVGVTNIPYITRTEFNNGINLFIPINQKDNYSINEGNVITIGLDTQTVFYQPHEFYTGQNIQILRHKNLNKNNALFIIPLIKIQMQKFNWGGNGATLGRLARTKIVLPIDSKGEPDWAFMEQYICNLHNEKKKQYKSFVDNVLMSINYSVVPKLEEKTWEEFEINKLFNTRIGKSIDGNKIDKMSGDIPYITRKEKDNGLDGFINYDTAFLSDEAPVITIGNETAAPFVQKTKFYTGTKVNILKPKKDLNEYVLFFIATSLRQQKVKYNYSYTINSTRLKQQKILLPINEETGEPDFDYMEQYIKNMMLTKYQQYR